MRVATREARRRGRSVAMPTRVGRAGRHLVRPRCCNGRSSVQAKQSMSTLPYSLAHLESPESRSIKIRFPVAVTGRGQPD